MHKVGGKLLSRSVWVRCERAVTAAVRSDSVEIADLRWQPKHVLVSCPYGVACICY